MAGSAPLPVRRHDNDIVKGLQSPGKKLDPGRIDTVVVGYEDHEKFLLLTALRAVRPTCLTLTSRKARAHNTVFLLHP
jgi:hypothetical protein